MTTKQLGNIGEANTIAKFVQMQIPVYPAFGDNERSDMIADFNGKLQRIQVKTSEHCIDGNMIFSLVSSTIHRKNGTKHIYTKEEVDYFALYNLEMNILLLVPFKEIGGKTQVSFKYEYQPSRNQFKTLNWKDYTFENIVSVETVHETSQEDKDTVQTTTQKCG